MTAAPTRYATTGPPQGPSPASPSRGDGSAQVLFGRHSSQRVVFPGFSYDTDSLCCCHPDCPLLLSTPACPHWPFSSTARAAALSIWDCSALAVWLCRCPLGPAVGEAPLPGELAPSLPATPLAPGLELGFGQALFKQPKVTSNVPFPGFFLRIMVDIWGDHKTGLGNRGIGCSS